MPSNTSQLGVPSYQRVRDAIRADIASGVLAPDTHLKIEELSLRYGLSPAPIREALGQLAAEGWIVLLPNRGARVRTIDSFFLRELNEIRIAVESYIVGLVALVATPAQIDALQMIEDEYEKCIRAGGPTSTLIEINGKLHAGISAIRPNVEVTSMLNRYNAFFNVMRTACGYSAPRLVEIAEEHRSLLAAIKQNDRELAEKVSRAHITSSMDDLLKLWKEAGRP